ncbi:conserved hypothetical protein [Desulforapulum autotrophicum HRM2]|uniref:SH3b domain-containing protein n=1 Tax=Desulforapulum autotrophicum (strain ATCC 43914 / DSM 3382 / VKM B-1955 / HRM2) TaxID=177437 RepID=C0Q8Y3_DESAH|nr:TIGR04211 family SH3 domain-containing protein [Desulforapulum autotrophicum]ACN14473.1 conserved hypothetical protein [Desulforapulum autotrophicum HRM2]
MGIREKMRYAVTCRQGIVALCVLLAICSSVQVSAETGYVTDMLLLTMRSGPGDGDPVLKTLPSNTAVEILEKGETYYKVRTGDGGEGWVKGRYITYEPPPNLVIKGLEQKIEALEAAGERSSQDADTGGEKLAALESSLDEVVKEKSRIATDLENLTKTHEQFLERSKDCVSLIEENKSLKVQNQMLSSELATIKTAGTDVWKTAMVRWFLAGAGVLIVGWIIGRITGSSRKSSRY